MTLVILLLAVLAFIATTGPAQSAKAADPSLDHAAQTHAQKEENRHVPDEGPPPQPLLRRTGLSDRKASPGSTVRARSASRWQRAASLAHNPAQHRAIRTPCAILIQRSFMANHARTLSGVTLASAQTRAS
jgi:hypothetical protein